MELAIITVGTLFAFILILITIIIYTFSDRLQLQVKNLLGFLLSAALVYTIGYAMELISEPIPLKIFLNNFQYIGLPLIAPGWFMLSIQYKNRKFKWTFRKAAPLFIIPAITFILNISGLYYNSHSIVRWHNISLVIYEKGFWYYIQAAYNSILETFTVVLYFSASRKALGIAKLQSRILMILSILGFLVSAFHYFSPTTSSIDSGAFFVSFLSIILFFTLYKYEVFDLQPLAYYRLFEYSYSPIIILSDSLQIVKQNKAAENVFGDNLYKQLAEILEDHTELIDSLKSKKDCLIKRNVDGEHIYFAARLISLGFKSNLKKELGYVLTLTNETAHINQVQTLKTAASMDALTGAYNRRYFFENAEHMIKDAKNKKKLTSIMMIDIDSFKSINDLYGHLAGDYVLRSVCSIIRGHLKEDDVLARFGGEEFILMLSVKTAGTAKTIAERICTSVRKNDFIFEGQIIKITVSIGISAPSADLDLQRRISQADSALYKAKKRGRDCFYFSEFPETDIINRQDGVQN